jgi:hypothetical protein
MNPKDSIDIAYEKIKKLRDSGHKYLGYPVYDVSKRDLQKVMSISEKYGIPFGWIMNLIKHETASTFNPAIRNSIGATGLIQFMTKIKGQQMYYYKADGTGKADTNTLKKMSFYDQLDYVEGYLYKRIKNILNADGKVPNNFTQGQLFMTVFYPVAVSNPNYVFPEDVQRANSGIRTPKDYFDRALKKPIFTLNEVPFSVAEVKKKFGEVFNQVTQATTDYTKKNWIPIVVVLVGVAGLVYYLKKSKVIKFA